MRFPHTAAPRLAVACAAAWLLTVTQPRAAASTMTLEVVDRNRGKVAGATVELLPHPVEESSSPQATARTGAEGTARLAVPEGSYRARVRAEGFVERLSGILVVPTADDPPELTLFPGSPLTGRVLDTKGVPVASAELCLELRDRRRFPAEAFGTTGLARGEVCVESNAEGRVTTATLPHGSYELKLSAPDRVTRSMLLDLGPHTDAMEWRLRSGGRITGRLVNGDGESVAGAVLRLRHREIGSELKSTTDEEGALAIAGLAPGHWTLRIEPPQGAVIVRDGVEVREGRATSLGTLRTRPGLDLAGRIVDDAGEPIAGAEISVRDAGRVPRQLRLATSDEDGRFLAGGLPERPVFLLIDGPEGHAAAALEDLVPPERDLRVTLRATGSVCGRVHDENGTVPPGVALVALAGQDGILGRHDDLLRVRSREVDPDTGRFCIEDVFPAEEVTITATAPGFQHASSAVGVEPGEESGPVELTLRRGVRLEGTVTDGDGIPLRDASVRSERGAMVFTDGRGEFRLDGLSSGMNKIVAAHEDHATAGLDVMLPLAEDEALVVVLEDGGTIEGTVTRHDGRPAEGVTIVLAEPSARAMTDADGNYRLRHVPAGSRRVSRTNPGRYDDFEHREVEVIEGETHRVDFELGVVLEGRLLRAGAPVPGAVIALAQPNDLANYAGSEHAVRQTVSDENGNFRLAGVRPGWGTVTVDEPRQSTIRPLEVPAGEEPRLDLYLPDRLLSGKVVDATDDRGLSDASVTARLLDVPGAPSADGSSSHWSSESGGHGVVYNLKSEAEVRSSSGAGGTFELFVDDSPEISIGGWYPGYRYTTVEVDPSDAVVIPLTREVRIAVNLRDLRGNPVGDSRVCWNSAGEGSTSRACSRGGSARVEQTVREGRCTILASASGFATRVLERDLEARDDGAVQEIDVDLVPGASLRIRLAGRGGESARVSGLVDPAGMDRSVLVEDRTVDPGTGDMRWDTWPLQPGVWTVTVETGFGDTLEKTVEVVPGRPIELVFP